MLMAQPSTYDMFALIELYDRKVQSVLWYVGWSGQVNRVENK
jgi:hypothetical protein